MPTPYQPATLAAPNVYPESRPFWEAASRGELVVGHCRACQSLHWYPRGHCPHCGSLEVGLKPVSGRGHVYSLSVTRKAGPIPFAIAYITLDEDITLLSRVVETDLDAVKIGDRVEVCFVASESGQLVPVFKPAPVNP